MAGQSPDLTLGHYRIVSKLGVGGMGEVYLAHDSILDRKVALKILPENLSIDELGVTAVMTGHVAQRGEALSISVELVDVRSTKLLWGRHYDRKLTELLKT